MVVYTGTIAGGGNIARYGGIPDQIYRARAGLPLRTVYLECSQVYTHPAVVRNVLGLIRSPVAARTYTAAQST